MGLQLATFPHLPDHLQTVTLEASQYRLRFTWRHRCQGWYLDLLQLDETPIALGRRMSPGWSPLAGFTLEDAPPGLFFIRGTDQYPREDLGTNLRVLYYTRDELAAAQVAPTGDQVVITL